MAGDREVAALMFVSEERGIREHRSEYRLRLRQRQVSAFDLVGEIAADAWCAGACTPIRP